MNKEEVKKAIKALICSQTGKCYFPKRRNCRTCLEQNRRIIKNYIKELEQKETILDKVTDKLKGDIVKAKEQIKYWEKEYQAVYIKKDEFYKNSYKRQINMWQSRRETLQEILNVIEGGE